MKKISPNLRSHTIKMLALAAALGPAGCAVGPDFKKPAAPSSAGYSPTPLPDQNRPLVAGGEAQRLVPGQNVPGDWWQAFNCPALNTLVERALRKNDSITAAKASLRQAQELVSAQQGGYYPSVDASYNFERQQLAGNLGGNSPGIQGNGSVISTTQGTPAADGGTAPFNGPVTFNFHTLQLSVGYTLDVFGENRRQVESLAAQAAMQRYELAAAYVTLAANVVGAAIQEAATRAQIDSTEKIIAANTRGLAALKNQRQAGYASDLDVATQEAALAQAQQTLPPLQKQLEQTRDLIRMLAGNLPNEDVAETFDFSMLHLPADLPLSLPSLIIRQRPDVLAAEEQLRSANAQLGAAIANRLPQFTLTATGGGTATRINQMFSNGGPFWTLVGNVDQPLFDGFTLLHRQRAARQALLQAAAQYRSTVVGAYQNVADTLHALVADTKALKAAAAAEHTAAVSLALTQRQFQVGYAGYLPLLNSEAAHEQAEIAVVQAQAGRYADTVALFQSLGGGWWARPDLTKN